MLEKYNIGINISTKSVGVAVVNNNFKLVQYKKKNIWSAIKFDEAETAEGRRLNRLTRRLILRKKIRINHLRYLIGDEVLKDDPMFFKRLEQSFKNFDDKENVPNKFNLFTNKEFNDIEYYKKYPTIYHLRMDLIKNKEKKDIRLIYLALHHLIKYRGHFVFEGEDFKDAVGDVNTLVKLFLDYIGMDINLSDAEITNIIEYKYKSKQEKINDIADSTKLTKEEKAKLKEVIKGMLGMVMDIAKVFPEVSFEDKNKIQMSDENIDDILSEFKSLVDEEQFNILDITRQMYSKLKLDEILAGTDYISEAMILKYKKFEKDLEILKRIIKENCNEKDYIEMFIDKTEEIPSFTNYMKKDIKLKAGKKGLDEIRNAFYSKIKKLVAHIDSEDVSYVLDEINQDKFLVRLNTTSNSLIPYQLHLKELEEILDNQGVYYPVLKENKEKISKILSFRIPYYVGPLSKTKTEFAWIKRSNEKIYPWNFEEVVDIESSAEEFINRITGKCTYLLKEPVLPSNSILYTEYLYYTEVNKIRFNGKVISKAEKEALKQEVFLQKNIVTEDRKSVV